MNKFWQVVIVFVFIFVAFAFYWDRYQIVTANYAYAPAFYKINRFTGETTLTVGKEYVSVEGVEAKRTGEPGVPSPKSTPSPGPGPAPAPPASPK